MKLPPPGSTPGRIIARWPRPSLAAASLLDRLGRRVGQEHPAYFRSLVIGTGLRDRSEGWPYPRVASGPDPLSLKPPMVLVSFHAGAPATLGALLERLPGDVLVMRKAPGGQRRRLRSIDLSGGEWQRIGAARTAVDTLRSGGFVFLLIDEPSSSRVHTTLLGRPISFAGGAFALARTANAPIVPVAAKWQGRKVNIVVGDAISPGEPSAMAGALANWLEGQSDRSGALPQRVFGRLRG